MTTAPVTLTIRYAAVIAAAEAEGESSRRFEPAELKVVRELTATVPLGESLPKCELRELYVFVGDVLHTNPTPRLYNCGARGIKPDLLFVAVPHSWLTSGRVTQETELTLKAVRELGYEPDEIVFFSIMTEPPKLFVRHPRTAWRSHDLNISKPHTSLARALEQGATL